VSYSPIGDIRYEMWSTSTSPNFSFFSPASERILRIKKPRTLLAQRNAKDTQSYTCTPAAIHNLRQYNADHNHMLLLPKIGLLHIALYAYVCVSPNLDIVYVKS
jgi:hypothetical protein